MITKREYEQRSLVKVNKRGAGGAVALLLLLPLAAWAGGVVTSCTEAALRATMTGGGVVTFAFDGTIVLANTMTNDTDVTLDGSGHNVTISGGGAVRVFSVNTNVSFTAVNLTIAEGNSVGGSAILNLGGTVALTGVTFGGNTATPWGSNGDWSPQAGGAIFNRGGTVNATNCSFGGNTAQTSHGWGIPSIQVYGGAIRNEAGEVNLRSCAFVGNQASGGPGDPMGGATMGDPGLGGAIHNSGTVMLDLCTLAGNSATGGAGGGAANNSFGYAGFAGGEGSGGAIFNEGTLTIDRTTLCGNTAMGGSGGAGGGDNSGQTLNGYAGGAGGGANGAAICNLGSLWVTRSTLVSNVVTGGAGGGGGGGRQFMSEYGGNGGSGGNGSSGLGGALFNGGAASIVNCTIAFNAGSGGAGGNGGWGGSGIHYSGSGGAGGNGGSGLGGVDGTCNLVNCTVASNRGDAGGGGAGGAAGLSVERPGVPGAPGSSGSAWGGTACGPMVNTLIASNSPAGGDSFADPKLGPLANNGGPTLTMALLPGSPAIDAGDTSLAPATDQRGFSRPIGLAADVGAFEYGSVMSPIAVSRSGATGLSIVATGNPGRSCRLLSSTDLSSWVPIATNQVGSDGTILFNVNCPPGSACQFYRLVMP